MNTLSFNKQAEDIYQSVHDQDFKRTEKLLLDLIPAICTSDSSDYLLLSSLCDKLYIDFDQEYTQWLQSKGYATSGIDLDAEEYTNYMISEMSDPDAMDDLLYELTEYAEHLPEPENKEELEYQYMCYKKNVGKDSRMVGAVHEATAHYRSH